MLIDGVRVYPPARMPGGGAALLSSCHYSADITQRHALPKQSMSDRPTFRCSWMRTEITTTVDMPGVLRDQDNDEVFRRMEAARSDLQVLADLAP